MDFVIENVFADKISILSFWWEFKGYSSKPNLFWFCRFHINFPSFFIVQIIMLEIIIICGIL